MRSLVSAALLCSALAGAGELPYFAVLSEDAGPWPAILSSIGFQQRPPGLAHVFIARAGTAGSLEWNARVEKGAILILEEESSLAEVFGFRRGKQSVRVGSLSDIHRPKLPIVWEQSLELPVFELPEHARVFARERWTGVPMVAGFRRGAGAVLWMAASPGERGYERFPYLLQALCDLGLEPPFRSFRLWAFFDSDYRSRVDVDYFAARWRNAGIAALHVAAWHFYDADGERDAFLVKLIEACHREGILVYAWLELPHVSERFWDEHPEWREKTGVLQDAQLDWRKLMNLSNRECFRAVSTGVRRLMARYDWDGVNLAELYFESLEGISNPARFTPMNEDVRDGFRIQYGFDPIEVFTLRKDPQSQRMFLDFRSELASRMQREWLGVIEIGRYEKPYLDTVLTHVDDQFDPRMHDAIGADAASLLPLLDGSQLTFLIEDPATIWHLGPERYRSIAEHYAPLTARRENLGIDINIGDRYQNVYPTKPQTGTELFQLVHEAALNFGRVALYSESSLLAPDVKLLSSATASATRVERLGPKLVVNSEAGVGIPWKGAASVDGELWPVADKYTVWLPAGAHTVETAPDYSGPHLLSFNGELKSARVAGSSALEFSYQSSARSIAIFDRPPVKIRVDGTDEPPVRAGPVTVLLPRGQHVVMIFTE